jgi:hypothetical protein
MYSTWKLLRDCSVSTFSVSGESISESRPLLYFVRCWCFKYGITGQSHWPRGLRRRSAAARLLRSRVRIPPGAWMSVCCECCVLSGRGLCDELITRPEESYRWWRVVECDIETSWLRRPTGGLSCQKNYYMLSYQWLYINTSLITL